MENIAIDGLRAAQASAGHAFAGAVAAWVAIAVNVVGLLFIWAQLRSNQKAVRAAALGADAAAAAARIALMSERPWIRHGFADDLTIELNDGVLEISLGWEWQNVGKTPAMRVISSLHLVENGEGSLDRAVGVAQLLRSPAPNLFPGEIGDSRQPLVLGPNDQNADAGWRFVAVIVYSIPGDPERRVTAGEYRLRKGNPAGQANRMYPAMANSWIADISPAVLSSTIQT